MIHIIHISVSLVSVHPLFVTFGLIDGFIWQYVRISYHQTVVAQHSRYRAWAFAMRGGMVWMENDVV